MMTLPSTLNMTTAQVVEMSVTNNHAKHITFTSFSLLPTQRIFKIFTFWYELDA